MFNKLIIRTIFVKILAAGLFSEIEGPAVPKQIPFVKSAVWDPNGPFVGSPPYSGQKCDVIAYLLFWVCKT